MDKMKEIMRTVGVPVTPEMEPHLEKILKQREICRECMKHQPPPDPRRSLLQFRISMRIREMSLAGVKITREILDRVEREEDEKLTEEETAKRPVE
ncbi:hypothetical protein CXU17_05760 [Akkermansia muciniphila]|nr:hypothetical protein CXU17_05760 [Akkermansia muciniphila]